MNHPSLAAAPRPPVSLPLARLLAHTADAVQAVRAGQSLNEVLLRCPADARAGTQALTFAALRRLGSAMAARAVLAPKKPPPPVEALLLASLALLWPGDEAAYAEHTLVDQAVAAARARQAASSGFVNAVLRRFLRERTELAAALSKDPVALHNHPAWWIDRLRQDWPGQWAAVLAANNQRAPMTLRVNPRHGATGDYLARLAAQGRQGRIVGPHAIELTEPCAVGELPGFEQGHVSVQDAAAQWAAPWLLGLDDPRLPPLGPGARVLDACAAPGGKTAHLLELADVDVTALDRDEKRLRRVHQNLQRLGLQAQVVAADAGEPGDGQTGWWDGRPFDAILLDAPCSASGIVRRHPDVRWLRRETDIAALAATQARLLDALWPLLAPGGRLLYGTCSVFKAEGQAQIDAFLQRQAQAQCLPHPVRPGHHLPLHDNSTDAGPPLDGASADGFFYALLLKPC
jgi:16S rRNA (cytosine967-C5)-methyltransferase